MIALAAQRRRLQLVHDPSGVSPFTLGRWAGRFRRVVTIHDAIAFRYPQGYPAFNNFLHRTFVPATIRNVDRVITDSRYSGQDLVELAGIPSSKISVVPLGTSPEFRQVDKELSDRVMARYALGRGPYLLCVGAQQERKNLGRLLQAFARVHCAFPDLRLVIAGPKLWHVDDPRSKLTALGIADAVTFLGYVAEADLPALYSRARLFVFPSLYEGFGLPVLEAMACGTPVVCANTSSLPEVAGDAAVLIDPTNVNELAAGITRVLGDPELQRLLRERGLARAAEFSWERTARETVTAYYQALDAAA